MKILYIGNDLSKDTQYHNAFRTLKQNLTKEGFEVIGVSSKKNKVLRFMDMVFSVFVNARKVSYVIIDVFSTSAFYFALITSQLSRMFGVKYIPVLHGGNLPLRIHKNPWLSDCIFKNSHINIAPSGYLNSFFKAKHYKSVLITNSIDLVDYKFKQRSHLQPKLLYVRAFAKIYNPIMAIEVLHKLIDNYPKATLCMVGPDRDGSLQEVKQRIEELQLSNHVTITGVLPRKDWHKLAEEYDVFINTTHVDNTPVSLIEVMALGLPIVSTNVGGIPFLIKHLDDGVLVKPNDCEEMKNEIVSLLTDKYKVETITKSARMKVENRDWKIIKNQWIKILK